MMNFAIGISALFFVIGLALCFMDCQGAGLTLIIVCSINLYQFVWADHRAPIVREQDKCETDGFTWVTTDEVIMQGGHNFLNGYCAP